MSPTARTLALSVDPATNGDLVTATLKLRAGGEPLTLALTIPAGETTAEALLPVLQGLSSLFAARGEARVEQAGKTISCRAGCGACCRQLVPVAGAEARHLDRLVAAMPEPRRTQVRARFDAALAALDAAALLDRLADSTAISSADQGMAYFRLGIPCPFLEDESCSIHPDRPLGCREYLVTSPAENCADTEARDIEMVPLAWNGMGALIGVDAADRWVPLVLALRYAAAAPPPVRRTGRTILSAVVATMVK